MAGWYIEKGPESDVVVSSRIRLARNFNNYPFPAKINAGQALEVIDRVKQTLDGKGRNLGARFDYTDIQKAGAIKKQVLVEKHLISPDMLHIKRPTGVFISRNEKISIMVNEEDHIRIQSMNSGMRLDTAWESCIKYDDALGGDNVFSYNCKFGYLTSCPTNVGTGMRVSVMLHLPALVMTGYIGSILEACGKLGIAVRGIFGENTEASGNMFQISNQVSLGHTESEMVEGITSITGQIMEQERLLRAELRKQDAKGLEDKIYRAWGIFSNARIISADESIRLLSDIRLGVNMGIIGDIGVETVNELMLLIQPANLQKHFGRALDEGERDVVRSDMIRGKLFTRKTEKGKNKEKNNETENETEKETEKE